MNQKSGPNKVTRGLFPTGLPAREWITFEAEGFAAPVCGVIYRLAAPASNGMPLGSLDTGCIDLETSGMLGYCSIFNTHTPRRGPLNLPFLGLSTGGTTWVLCDPSQIKRYEPPHLERDRTTYPPLPEGFPVSVQDLKLDSVRTVKEIHYWGHYPIADLEYEIDALLDIGLRAWAPFLPGDIERSLLPGIVFEVHVRNSGSALQRGTLAFSFPGPTVEEAGGQRFNRSRVSAQFNGVVVEGAMASFALGVDSAMQLRVGGELGVNGEAWSRIADELPEVVEDQPGTSVALNFTLTPGEETVVRFVLTWYSPQWRGGGYPASLEGNTFTHMYAKYYPNPVQTAAILIREHKSLLKRVLAWQEAIFTEEILPGWMQDSLINVLHLIAEGSLWAQNESPLPDWVRPEDGLFGMIESPRDCPDIAVVCCTYWDQIPVVYFFPQLALSTLRGFKNYQDSEGVPPFMFGGYAQHTPPLEFTSPRRGYQLTTNLPSYIAMAHRYWLVTGDGDFLEEFYPSLKRS
ncbi:MAG: GH116 family glycosyl-hydrolase, partial [Anaerolineales bacterium]